MREQDERLERRVMFVPNLDAAHPVLAAGGMRGVRRCPRKRASLSLQIALALGAGLGFGLGLSGCSSGGDSADDSGSLPDLDGEFTLSGTLRVEALNRVDGDTADPDAAIRRNNAAESAQRVAAPVIIGGFVVDPRSQAAINSRFGAAGDEFDSFRVTLAAGQSALLDFDASAGADLDLLLFDAQRNLVDESISAGASRETVTAPSGGDYFVVVSAFAGGSNYTLRVLSPPLQTTARVATSATRPEVVPGEFIVRLRESVADADAFTTQSARSVGAADSARQALRAAGFRPASAAARGERVGRADVASSNTLTDEPVSPREELWQLPPENVSTAAAVHGETRPSWLSDWMIPTESEARLDAEFRAKRMQAVAGVLDVSPNYHMTTRFSNDPRRPLQWSHERMNLPLAWQLTRGLEREVVVAIVDTGVILAHEDLGGRLVPGFDFVSNPDRSGDGDGIDPNPDDPGDNARRGESSWHGTHVAGIVAAATDNQTGIAGISWGARVMPVRVLGRGGGTLFDVMQGVRFAAGLPNDSGTTPARAADIINLSLGGGGFSQATDDLFREIRDRGILVVAASGNEGSGSVGFPAAYDAVIAVGATDAQGRRAPYSNFGAALEVVAPGGDLRRSTTGLGFPDGILSLVADDTSGSRQPSYTLYQGTSMASPAVAGVLALGRSILPGMDTATVRGLLAAGDLTSQDDFSSALGWGEIDAARSVNAFSRLAGGEQLPARLASSVARLDFGRVEATLRFRVANPTGGAGAVAFEGIPPWLRLTPVSVDGRGLGEYVASADRSGLPAGSSTATLVVRQPGAENDLILPVSVVVDAESGADDIGRTYVLLTDEAGETVSEVVIRSLGDGVVSYRFDNVPAGRYRLVAGTDMNGDFQICDPFEGCGAWPTLSLPEFFDVSGDRSGLDFSVGFSTPDFIPAAFNADSARTRSDRSLRSAVGTGAVAQPRRDVRRVFRESKPSLDESLLDE